MTGQELFERYALVAQRNGHSLTVAQWYSLDESRKQVWDLLAEDLGR